MDFITLDKNYQSPIWLRPINVQWNAKHYECGDFSIQISTDDYETDFAYVYCNDREQMGIIQKVSQTQNVKGKFTQLSGFFLERLLHDYVIREAETAAGENICAFAARIIQKYADQGNYTIDPWGTLGQPVTMQLTPGFLDEALFSMLKQQKIAFRVYYDFVADELHIRFAQGLDRTQSQTTNNTVVFSPELKNLDNIEYNADSSNYRNYAIVVGGDLENDPVTVIVDARITGDRRRELRVEAGEIRKEEGMTDEDLQDALKARGQEELAQYLDIRNISFDTQNDMVTYLEDYDLGDIVDIIVPDMGQAYESEIIEVDEVLKNNQHTINLILGDKIPTQYDKTRR